MQIQYSCWDTVDFKALPPNALWLVYIQEYDGERTTWIEPCHGVMLMRDEGDERSTVAIPAAWDCSEMRFHEPGGNCFDCLPEAEARRYDCATWELVDFDVRVTESSSGERRAFATNVTVKFMKDDVAWTRTHFDADKLPCSKIEEAVYRATEGTDKP